MRATGPPGEGEAAGLDLEPVDRPDRVHAVTACAAPRRRRTAPGARPPPGSAGASPRGRSRRAPAAPRSRGRWRRTRARRAASDVGRGVVEEAPQVEGEPDVVDAGRPAEQGGPLGRDQRDTEQHVVLRLALAQLELVLEALGQAEREARVGPRRARCCAPRRMVGPTSSAGRDVVHVPGTCRCRAGRTWSASAMGTKVGCVMRGRLAEGVGRTHSTLAQRAVLQQPHDGQRDRRRVARRRGRPPGRPSAGWPRSPAARRSRRCG